MFCQNEGKMDRGMRIGMGIVLIALGWFLWNPWGVALGVIGLVPLLTGILGWCPLYALFKFTTCETKGPTGTTTATT
ncbi:MAG: DUF2892 domain-containing protein [Nitrospinae bacterium]|nr:DUF2892 domain-containing protein [Nitrospinota bacterium]